FDVAAKKAEPLTDTMIEPASPTWSPDGKSIAFLGKEGKDSDRYNTWNVYVTEARSGAAPRQITHYDGVHSSAARAQVAWSPDGTKLAYLQRSAGKFSEYKQT